MYNIGLCFCPLKDRFVPIDESNENFGNFCWRVFLNSVTRVCNYFVLKLTFHLSDLNVICKWYYYF
jgi:hypothetical protein